MMTIKQAVKVLKEEREFLGISWEELFVLCRAESSALKLAALDAYDAYQQHLEDHQWLENVLEDM
jgi:hypothetical protein